jgi:hypothetical protein
VPEPNEQKILEKVEAVEAQLVTHLEKMEDERVADGQVAAETAEKVSELTDNFIKLQGEAKEELTKANGTIEQMTERIDDLETLVKRGETHQDIVDELMSPGERFVQSKQYLDMVAANDIKCGPVDIKSFFPEESFGRLLLKTNLLSTPPSRLVMPERLADIQAPSLRQLRLRDLIPVRPTQSNSVEYVREVGFNTGTTSAVTTAAVSSGVATITQTAHGYPVGVRVRIAGVTDETDLNGDHWITSAADADTYTFVTTAGDTAGAAGTITALLLQTHGAAAETAEAGTKPEGQLDLELLSEPIQTIAHWIPASRQILADHGQMEAYVNDRLRYGVLYKEDIQILYGTGTSPQIQGIMTELGVQEYLWSDGVVTPADTKIDAIRRAMTRAHVAEYVPTGVVVNPNDWEDIQLTKDGNEQYIWLNVATGTGQQFFLVPVVVTNAINAGEALVGSFAIGSTLWDREQVNVRVSESHDTMFIENMVAILGEERVCQTIHRPDSFVKVTFDAAPS